jgi:hypothetical protein
MPHFSVGLAVRVLLTVVTLILVVHWPSEQDALAARRGKDASKVQQPSPAAPRPAQLPAPVAEMREAILAAVRSGHIEDLRTPLEWNELAPVIANQSVADPIAYWKQVSGDGEGREILAILAEILEAGYAVLPVGADIENNRLYVWPALAEVPLHQLTPAQEVQLYRFVTPGEVKRMREKGTWTWYRLAIGADGTWHAFRKTE